MEKQIVIKKLLPLQERSYTDNNGQTKVFASRGIVFRSGVDEYYGEAVGDTARSMPQDLDLNVFYTVQGTMKVREWKDSSDRTRYDNTLIITKIG